MAEEFVTEEELVNGDPELSGTNYDEMLDIIMGNEFMRRPDVESGWTTTEDGQAITNYEAMSNEERKAAWDEWYNAATEYGVENLNGSELMAYVATGYRLGYLTAEEADEYYDQAWSEMSAANGWELQDDGVTWRKETEGGGGRTIVETRTQPSFADGDFGESGAWDGNIGESLGPGSWTDYGLNPLLSQENYTRVVEGATGLQGLVDTVLSDIMPVAVKATLTWATGQALGPLLTNALVGAGVPAGVASSIATGIASQAANVLMEGEFDIAGALIAGAGEYLSALEINEILGEAEGVFTEITEQVDKFQELISTGNSIADAAIQAGGVNMLAQFALTGEVDMTQALAAAISAGGKQALDEFAISANLTEDELQQFFAEDDELQQAAIDADIKDPFLNPNYSTVGDGLMVDTDGNVFNYDGEKMGTMDELDTNNDGMLTGSDLQEVGDTAEFNQQYAPPETTTSPTIFTKEWADERYAGMSEAQIKEQMARDGFNDEQIKDYISTLPEIDTTTINHAGGWTEDTSQPYTLHYRDGRHYVVSNGYLKAITEEQYTDLYADLQDGTASLDSLEQYGVGNPGLSGGGEVVTGVNPITGEGSFDPQSDWISLDPSEEQVVGQIEFTEEPPETEPVEPIEETKTDEPAPDPLQSEDEQLEGATGEPATGAEPGGSSLEQLTEQLQQAIAAGDFELANEISEQIDQLEADQKFDDLQPESEFEDEKDSENIVDADGTIQQPTGGPTIDIPMPADKRTEWQKNKDYIVEKVNAGEATEGQQEWYDKWIESGSPETKDGMSSGTGSGETPATGDGGGIVSDGETGAPGETEKPNVIGIGGPTIGSGLSSIPMPGMFDKGTGDPDIGQGPGGTGEGGRPEEGMLTQQSNFTMPEFKPFNFSLNYQTPEIMPIIPSGQKDYSIELDGIIGRSLFKGIV